MNTTEYKRYHESFMENNHGSSLLHTFICIFYIVQCSFQISIQHQYKYQLIQYIYEYVFMVLPMIVVYTVLTAYIKIFAFINTIFLVFKLWSVLNRQQIERVLLYKNTFRTKRILSITCIRGLTYLITVFSILAVDFVDFPRYLAKTERFGYSLMDTGVGLFVLISGLVHRDLSKDNSLSVLKGNVKFIIILVALGLARFVSLKQLDYQQHVTEYGVHWNFFLTLAVCKLISTIILLFFTQPLLLSIATLILHEVLLHNSLQEWVFSDTPRTSFLDANREGVASSLGYVSMYLFAAHLKRELSDQTVQRFRLFTKLVLGSMLLWFLSYFVNTVKPASRTLANSSYCLYLATILMSITTLMYILEVLSQNKERGLHFEVPLILSAINTNGLVFFLIANLTTGLINMSMQTLLVPTFSSFVILNTYMIFTITVTVYLNKCGVYM